MGWRADARITPLAAPITLGLLQAAATVVLVSTALAAPAPSDDLRGLVNDTNSKGSRRRLALVRDDLDWLPLSGIELAPTTYVWSLRGALVALAVVQLAALVVCLRQSPASWRPWAIGPALTSVALLAYPPLSADLFYYAISGRIANSGANPYLSPPKAFPNDPLLPFNDWTGITSPYGPLWTTVSRGLDALVSSEPVALVLAYKLLAGLSALGLAVVAATLAARLTGDPRRAAAAFVLVAWQPAVLLESAGTAHNDATMLLLALGGLLLLIQPGRGAVRGGLLLIAASALIKFVTLPLLVFAVFWRLRPGSTGGRWLLRHWALDLGAISLLTIAAFAPYWDGPATVRSLTAEPARLYVNPFWVLPRLEIDDRWGREAALGFRDETRTIALWTVGALLVGTLGWLLVRTLRDRRRSPTADGPDRDRTALRRQARAWAVATAALALLPVNAHAWYAVWCAAPIAVAWATTTPPAPRTGHGRRWRRPADLPWWLLLYLAWTAASFVIYHTRVAH